MPSFLATVVVLAYASLALELTVFHVPSVASSRRIWLGDPTREDAFSHSWRGVFALSRVAKAAFFFLPVLVIWGVYLYPLVVLFGSNEPPDDRAFGAPLATNVAAVVLVLLGRAVTLHSVLTLRRSARRGSGGLRTDGLFRYSRNPGLVGMYAFVLGLWLAAPSLIMLAGIVAYVVYMDFKVRMEEDFLGNTVGDAYRAYQRRTPRYLT